MEDGECEGRLAHRSSYARWIAVPLGDARPARVHVFRDSLGDRVESLERNELALRAPSREHEARLLFRAAHLGEELSNEGRFADARFALDGDDQRALVDPAQRG